MSTQALSWVRGFLPPQIQHGKPEQARQGAIVVLFSFALALWGPIEGTTFWLLGLPIGAATCAVGICTILAGLWLLRRTGSVRLGGHWLAAQMYLIVLGCSLEVGGLHSSAVAWDAAVPVFATMVAGRRAGVLWLGLVVAKFVALGAAASWGILPPSHLAPSARGIYDFCVLAGAAAMMTSLAWLYENEKDVALEAVEVESGRVRDAHAQSRRILDNVSEGLAVVDVDGSIQPVRSAIVERWFGQPSPDASLWAWLEPLHPAFANALELGWQQMHAGILPVDVAIDQLPVELHHADSTYRVAYHPLMQGEHLERVLVTISDVSAQLQARRSRMAYEDMMALVGRFGEDAQGCREFIAETNDAIGALRSADDMLVLRRIVHTLKGNSATFGMRGFADRLHACEDQLDDGEPPEHVSDAILEYWRNIGPVVQPLVGDPERIQISRKTLRSWARRTRRALPELHRAIASRLTESTGPRLRRFATGARELAQRLDKDPPQVEVSDGGVRVDPRRWANTWAGLTHLVRNCVDHGLESANDRVAAGKPPQGRLSLRTFRERDAIVVEVRDDGRGIDWHRVRRAAAAKGLPASTPRQLRDALFSDGLSTRDSVTATSGRGVGMASIRSAVEAMGGRIEVETDVGHGTRFRCIVPDDDPEVALGAA